MSNEFGKIEARSKSAEHGNLISYVIGFVLSIILTLSAYFLVTERVFTTWILIVAIAGLGIVQMCVQLLFFLHLHNESKPRWNLLAFLFMTLVVIILVFGSLWIMYSLDNRVMPAANIDTPDQKEI